MLFVGIPGLFGSDGWGAHFLCIFQYDRWHEARRECWCYERLLNVSGVMYMSYM